MNRYNNVQYNGIYLSEICDVEEVKLPVLPSRTLSSLDIASRDGEVYNGKKYNSCTIEVTVLIDCDTRKEAKEKLRELRETFDVNEPKPFFIDTDRFTLAITEEAIEKEAVAFNSYRCTINLRCFDPYFYSDEIKVVDSDDKSIEVTNSGNRPVAPIINVGFSTDAYFAQLELKETGEKILVGKYPQLELSQVSKSTRVLADNCETTSNWINSSASIDSDRTTGGTLAMNSAGSGVMIGTAPSGDTTWKGVCVRQNLTKAVDEFKLSCYMHHNSTGKSGDPTAPKYKNDEGTIIISGGTTTYYQVTCNSLNVRAGAGTSYKKLGTLAKGYKIKNGTLTNGWVKFTYNNKTGYCSSKYLTKKTETTKVTATVCNFVTVSDIKSSKYIYVRAEAKKSSKALASIPIGECVRCIIYAYTDPDSSSRKYYKLAKKYNGVMGYVCVENLVKAGNVTYTYDDDEDIETSDDKMGIVELYGFDSNGSQLFCLGMYDDNAWYEYTYPKCKIGNRTVLQDTTKVPKPKTGTTISKDSNGNATVTVSNKLSGRLGDWNEYYGRWILTKEKINGQYVWTVEVQKIKDGVTLKTQKTTNIKYSDLPTEALSYVVLYIGVNDTSLEKASGMDFTDIKIDEINPKEEIADKNITYFKEGDILEIDCENHRCYLNDEACDDLVDIGSRYFNIATGENNIKINSNDDGIVAGVIYREKWLGD